MTTTPSGVTTKPAFDMKLRLAGLPSADSPWTYQAEGDTCWAFKAGGEADCALAASVAKAASTPHAIFSQRRGPEVRKGIARRTA